MSQLAETETPNLSPDAQASLILAECGTRYFRAKQVIASAVRDAIRQGNDLQSKYWLDVEDALEHVAGR